jgi:hypothetical protein
MMLDTILGFWVIRDPETLETFLTTTKAHYTQLEQQVLAGLTPIVTTLETIGWSPEMWQQVAAALTTLRKVTNACLSHFARETTGPDRPIPVVFVASSIAYRCSLHYLNSKIDTATALLTAPSAHVLDRGDMKQQIRLLRTLRELEAAGREAIGKAMTQLALDEQRQNTKYPPQPRPAAPTAQHRRPTSLRLVSHNDDGDQAAAATQTTAATDCKDIFTLIFPGHRLAILEVHGAANEDEARAFASEAIPQCGYEVKDGDQAAGQAEIFYYWCSAAAQECQPHPAHRPEPASESRQSQEKERQITAAVKELVTQWGYRDITALIRRVYEQQQVAPFEYLSVLQRPSNEPFYCRRAADLFKELDEARRAGHYYPEGCPAPNPEKNLRLLVGYVIASFDDEGDEGQEKEGQA